MTAPSRRTLVLTISVALAAATILAYARLPGNRFTSFDDNEYVTDNPHVKAGLSWAGLAWAFTTGHASNWHPLTWLSHMLDSELFGMNAGGHHLTSLALHVATALLLFRFFWRTTGSIGASAFVAAAFALHPLHVESVAWAAERKDVLCAFLWILALLAYVRWVERPGPARYGLVFLLHALGLLAKPMIVTLPLTLLLLDLWPLRRIDLSRFDRAAIARLVREKVPLLALSLASSVTTFLVQRAGGAMTGGETIPFHVRLANAAVSYVAYLGKSLLPIELAAFYPHPLTAPPLWQIAACALLLGVMTAGALLAARARPWLTVGWLWFLGTLAPVIGIVQVGVQAMADRYTYVPMIGLSAAVAWSARELAERYARSRSAIAGLFGLSIVSWTALTFEQVGYWKDDVSLTAIARENVRDTYEARGNLGHTYLEMGRLDEAVRELRRSVELKPSYAAGHNDLGMAYELQDREEEAADEYREALRWTPDLAEAHHNLAGILVAQGRAEEAVEHYESALRSRPDSPETHYCLAIVLLARGEGDEGIAHLKSAVELEPGHEKAQRALRRALEFQGESPPK